MKNENLVCNLPVLPNVYASGDVGGPLRLDVGCVKVLGNKLCPSCRAFGLTNADIIHDAQCAAQALKERRAAAANVAKKKTFESLIVDNKVEVARAAGKAKAMAARDGMPAGDAFQFDEMPIPVLAFQAVELRGEPRGVDSVEGHLVCFGIAPLSSKDRRSPA